MSDSLNSACPQGDSEIEWFDLSTHNVVDEGPSHHGLFTRDKKKRFNYNEILKERVCIASIS